MWCVIIPTYNNSRTVRRVVADVLTVAPNVIVVDDGSTDGTAGILSQLDVTVVSHGRNRGKGAALVTGFRQALAEGYDYAVTIDSDGQHFATDIPRLVEAMREHPGSLIVGCRNLDEDGMPAGNTFANRFSNFWFKVQTGISLADTQTGLRMYPLHRLPCLRLLTSRYEAELALLVMMAWRGVEITQVAVSVSYDPEGGRVSHFRPVYDFARISLLNTVLCFFAVVYGLPAKLLRKL